MAILSCDTMVALGNSTKNGNTIFAKNSDRPLLESQPLVIYEAEDHEKGEMVNCTYISIPQVSHTYKVLGSKPYWIWGLEHGMNEFNVCIGNEAVWSRESEEKTNGLLGMDLLRLGLERGRTAYESMHIIIDLLETYGQGGNAAVNMEHRYCNAFLLADCNEAWILETCNRRWIAKKVKDVAGISNCYSIETEWDEASSDIKEHAYNEGWISRDVPFNFAKAYTSMNLKLRAALPRKERLNKLLNQAKGNITIDTMRRIQRDHFEGEIIAPRWNPADGIYVSICMHAMMESSSETAASSQIELSDGSNNIWWHAFGLPCISVYAPYSINCKVPKEISVGGKIYSDDSVWWRFEKLQKEIEKDYGTRSSEWREDIEKLEAEFIDSVERDGLTSDAVEQNTTMLLKKVEDMYSKIRKENKPIVDCEHMDINAYERINSGLD